MYPDETLENVIQDYEGYLNRGTIPTALVAVDENDNPLGTACFLAEDELPRFDHLTPWIGAVYVDPPYRKQGFGRRIIQKILDDAKDQGFSHVHLWTDTAKKWYEQLGWYEIETTNFGGHHVSIMRYDL